MPETTNCFQGRYRDRNEIEIDIEMMYITRFIYVTQLIIFHFPPITIFLSHFKHYPPINAMSQASQVGLSIWSITGLPLKVSLTSFRRLRTSVG